MKKYILNTYFLAIVACLLWSTAFAGIKMGLKYTSPFQFAGIRFFIAGILIIPLSKNIKSFIAAFASYPLQILKVSLFQTTILYCLFYWGISKVPGAITAIIIGSQPLFASLVAHVLQKNDKISAKKLFTISLGIAGIILIALEKGWTGKDAINQIFGIVLLVLANISSGIGNVLVSNQKGKIPSTILSAWQMSIGGLLIFIFSLFVEPFHGFFSFPTEYYFTLGWLSFLSAAAFTIWFLLLQRPGVLVSDLNIWKFIIPIFGAILSWIIIPGEKPELIPILGMIIIGISLVLYNLISRKS